LGKVKSLSWVSPLSSSKISMNFVESRTVAEELNFYIELVELENMKPTIELIDADFILLE